MSVKTCCSVPDTSSRYYLVAICCGLLTGYFDIAVLNSAASVVSSIFINLLKLVSLPIIFLSLLSTASGMDSVSDVKFLGRKVVKYTLFTTILAASIALLLFIGIGPVRSVIQDMPVETLKEIQQPGSYFTYLMQTIPSNIVQPFVQNNVIGVLFIAIALSLSILTLPDHHRITLHTFFSALYAAIMKVTQFIVKLMPFAVWAFITLFFMDLREGLEVKSLAYYLAVVLAANLIQAVIVLPALLKWKGISPLRMFRSMLPALSVAFFTKSSAAALPMAIRCAEDRAKISKKVASFSMPLCTTINMNACAAFILTTVLFVSMSNGMTFSYPEMALWVIIATVAAIGNAGVPMGCFFLSTAFLAAMNVPLNIMFVILPFYSLIDMLESAINVWSDSCVTAFVESEVATPVIAAAEAEEVVGEKIVHV
jgi:Na+/H+-dicarboxylate symporter